MGLVIISICMNLIISEQDQLRPRWFDYQTNLGWKLLIKCPYLHDINEDWGFRSYSTLHELILSRNNAQGVEQELCKMSFIEC